MSQGIQSTDSPLTVMDWDSFVFRSTSRLGSIFPGSRGCPGPGNAVLETLPGAAQLPEGLAQPGILCQHKRHQRLITAPAAHRSKVPSYTLSLGIFLVSREGKEVRKGIFPAFMSVLVLSDSHCAVCCAIPWKAEFCGHRQGRWGTGMVTGSAVVFLVTLGRLNRNININININISFFFSPMGKAEL